MISHNTLRTTIPLAGNHPPGGRRSHPLVRLACRGRRWAILAGACCSMLGSANAAAEEKPEIEFRVLLIIKKKTEAWSPVFLPVRDEMTDEEIRTARRCFEVETPDMVKSITRGKVRFVPSVHVSEVPLKLWNPDRKDSAEVVGGEILEEFGRLAKPGQYDSVGYYFLPRDRKSGYSIPRAGYGVGWCEASHALGMFAVHATVMHPRDEIFLHEWIHGLEQFYHRKPGVRLPKGWLHGGSNYSTYKEHAYRPGDSFKGWMSWYKDFLNCEVAENDGFSGLGSAAWAHGPMRAAQPAEFPKAAPIAQKPYPAGLVPFMRGDLAGDKLGENLLSSGGGLTRVSSDSWQPTRWSAAKENTSGVETPDSKLIFHVHNQRPDNQKLTRKIPLEAYRNYVLSAEIKTKDVRIVEQGGSQGAYISAGGSRIPGRHEGTGEWTPVSVCFTTGQDAAKGVEIHLGLGGSSSLTQGEVWFRNVALRKIPYPQEK